MGLPKKAACTALWWWNLKKHWCYQGLMTLNSVLDSGNRRLYVGVVERISRKLLLICRKQTFRISWLLHPEFSQEESVAEIGALASTS